LIHFYKRPRSQGKYTIYIIYTSNNIETYFYIFTVRKINTDCMYKETLHQD